MKLSLFSTLFLAFFGIFLSAQDTLSVQRIQKVVISDNLLNDYSQTQKTEKINDNIIKRNPALITALLNYNTLIHFKENGIGGASSPSFRGTTASQTAVIWNGININSQTLGQTDFNAVNSLSFNNIVVKSGGGSVLYGSSAIGGSIHLNSDLYFYDTFENELFLRHGSFNTYDGRLQTTIASDKHSLKVGFTHSLSENNYPWVGKNRKNKNGQFENSTFNADFGYKINSYNTIKYHSQYFNSERHFSLVISTETPTKYHNTNIRNLLEWTSLFDKFTSRVKLAHLYEQYKYFPHIDNPNFTFGKVESFIGKYDLAYDLADKIKLNTVFELIQNHGRGSDIKNEKREVGSVSMMFKHLLSDKFLYEVALRKETTNNYQSPFLYSFGTKYAVTNFYSVKLNASKNFRIPTFNDLYWRGSGKPGLKPETSIQAEITNELEFKNLKFSITAYHNQMKDMLRWVPMGSVWEPVNIDEVEIFGLETTMIYSLSFGKHRIDLNGAYGYTSSKDKKTNKYLIYVPFDKATAGIEYIYEKLHFYFEYLYTGEVYTTSDNNPKYNIDSYQVLNIGADYTYKNIYTFGVKIQNVFNVYYESVASRPLPGINFMMYLNIKV